MASPYSRTGTRWHALDVRQHSMVGRVIDRAEPFPQVANLAASDHNRDLVPVDLVGPGQVVMVAHVHRHGSEQHGFVEAEARRADAPRAEREPRPLGEPREQLELGRRHVRCPAVKRHEPECGIVSVRVPALLPHRVRQAPHEGAEHLCRLHLDRVPDAAAHERDGDLSRPLVESACGKYERVGRQDSPAAPGRAGRR
jgi:hypothetical protein